MYLDVHCLLSFVYSIFFLINILIKRISKGETWSRHDESKDVCCGDDLQAHIAEKKTINWTTKGLFSLTFPIYYTVLFANYHLFMTVAILSLLAQLAMQLAGVLVFTPDLWTPAKTNVFSRYLCNTIHWRLRQYVRIVLSSHSVVHFRYFLTYCTFVKAEKILQTNYLSAKVGQKHVFHHSGCVKLFT